MIDAAGCWSGCVTDDAGVPTAVYTANPDDARRAVVALARSDRSLLSWQGQCRGRRHPCPAGLDEVRDPSSSATTVGVTQCKAQDIAMAVPNCWCGPATI